MKSFWMSCFLVVGMVEAVWGQVSFAPEMLALSLQKGSAISTEIEVVNDQNLAKDVVFSMEYRDKGLINKPLSSWCSVEPSKVSLQPRTRQRLTIHLKYDDDFKGECELALFASELVPMPIALNVGVGIPVFLRLNGEDQATGEIISVKPEIKSDGTIEVQVQIKNTGALNLAPFGLVWVNDGTGQRIWQTDIRCSQLVFQNKIDTLKTTGILLKHPKKSELHVQVFWGTLYGMNSLGMPKKSEAHVPLQTASK